MPGPASSLPVLKGSWYSPAAAGGLCAAVSVVTPSNTGGVTISRDLRVNQMIRIPQVRVIDEEGNQLGVMPTPKALEMAQDRGLDLVEVAPMAAPPVTKFLDFGQYKYDLTKKEKEAKRRQRSVTFKEVRLSPKIGIGDFETKVHRAIEFLEEGDRIKVTVRFRGRELTHPELGRNLLAKFTDLVKDHGVPERTPILEGKSMFITMASTHKPKVLDSPVKPGRNADEEAPRAEAASTEPDTTSAPTETDVAPAPTEPSGSSPAVPVPGVSGAVADHPASEPVRTTRTASASAVTTTAAPVAIKAEPTASAPGPATTGE